MTERHQMEQPPPPPGSANANAQASTATTTEMDAFKQDIRMWLEMDTTIRALQANLRDRRMEHKIMTQRVLAFMEQHDIDDLNTPGGRLRFHVAQVKSPLSQQQLMQRITEFFDNDVIAAQQLRTAILGNRARTERASLRLVSWQRGG